MQQAVLDGDEVTVTSKCGRKVAFKYRFKLEELLSFKPTFNQSYNISEFVKGKIRSLQIKWWDWTDPFFQRIVDSQMYAILEILRKKENDF